MTGQAEVLSVASVPRERDARHAIEVATMRPVDEDGQPFLRLALVQLSAGGLPGKLRETIRLLPGEADALAGALLEAARGARAMGRR